MCIFQVSFRYVGILQRFVSIEIQNPFISIILIPVFQHYQQGFSVARLKFLYHLFYIVSFPSNTVIISIECVTPPCTRIMVNNALILAL